MHALEGDPSAFQPAYSAVRTIAQQGRPYAAACHTHMACKSQAGADCMLSVEPSEKASHQILTSALKVAAAMKRPSRLSARSWLANDPGSMRPTSRPCYTARGKSIELWFCDKHRGVPG